MIRIIGLLLISASVLFVAPTIVCAQSSAPAPTSDLSKKLDDQQAQIDQLKETLLRQAELIEQQRRQVESLQQKLAQPAEANEPVAATAIKEPVVEKSATTAEHLPSQPARRVDAGSPIKFNGLLQAWFASGNSSFRDTFRVRRAELKFTGEVTPRLKWTIMIDPSKALGLNNTYSTINGARVLNDTSVNHATRILQDAFITFDYSKRVHVNVGQFKVPLSLEGLQSSAKLDTVERALFISDRTRGGNYGDVRDLGVMVYGSLGSRVDYQVGFFNGGGENQNDVDKNDQKAVGGRFVARPSIVKGLQLGFSGAWSGSDRPDRARRDRLGAELLFVRGKLTLKSELMTGADTTLHRRGYYLHAGYRLKPKFEPVFRIDVWDPNTRVETDAANITETDYITGFNYYLIENSTKLQFNYIRKTFAGNILPAKNLVLMNLQTSW